MIQTGDDVDRQWCGAVDGGGELFCRLLLPLQKLLAIGSGNKDLRPGVVVQFSVDQCPHNGYNWTALEEGSTLTGTITLQQIGEWEHEQASGRDNDWRNAGTTSAKDKVIKVQPYPIHGGDGGFSGALQMQLILEGVEHCSVYVPKGEYETCVEGKHIFLCKEYDLKVSQKNLIVTKGQDGDSHLKYTIRLPDEMVNSMPLWSNDRLGLVSSNSGRGHCAVSYKIYARISMLPIKGTATNLSSEDVLGGDRKQPLVFTSASVPLSIFKKRTAACPSELSLTVSPAISTPMTALCGLYTYAHRDTYSLKLMTAGSSSSTIPIHLFPGQSLKISIVDDHAAGGVWAQRATRTTWKLTQRIRFLASDQNGSVRGRRH